jgi:hypothetical protein
VVSDDIVKWLKEEAVCSRGTCDDCDLHRNAAEEITRLRKAGDALAKGIRTGHWDDALDAWSDLRGK